MTRNPYQVALLAVGCFSFVMAYIFAAVLSEMTDFVTYDVPAAEALSAWMYLLIGAGAVMFVGAVVIAGVEWSLRHRGESAPRSLDVLDAIPARQGD